MLLSKDKDRDRDKDRDKETETETETQTKLGHPQLVCAPSARKAAHERGEAQEQRMRRLQQPSDCCVGTRVSCAARAWQQATQPLKKYWCSLPHGWPQLDLASAGRLWVRSLAVAGWPLEEQPRGDRSNRNCPAMVEIGEKCFNVRETTDN